MKLIIMRKVWFVALLMVLSLSSVGCSKDGSTSNSNGAEVVTMLMNQDDLPKLQPVVDQFMLENPHIQIDIEAVKFTEIDRKINLAHSSGNGYDIIPVNHTSTPQLVGGQVLEDLTPYLIGSSINLEKSFNPSNYDIANISGGQYALPYGPDVRVLAYNKTLLDRIGAEVPKTPQDMLDMGPALQKIGAYVMGSDRKNQWDPIYITGSFMLSMGANVYTKKGDVFTATSTTPEMIEYVEWVKAMYQFMPKDISVTEDQLKELFIQNKVAFYIYGPWEHNMRIPESGVDYGLTLIPTTGTTSSAMGGWLLGLGNNGRDKSSAWEFIEYLYEPSNMASISLALPPIKEAFGYEPFNNKALYGIFEEQMKTAQIPIAPMVNSNKIAEVYSTYFQQAITGVTPVYDAMEKAQIEIEKLLKTE